MNKSKAVVSVVDADDRRDECQSENFTGAIGKIRFLNSSLFHQTVNSIWLDCSDVLPWDLWSDVPVPGTWSKSYSSFHVLLCEYPSISNIFLCAWLFLTVPDSRWWSASLVPVPHLLSYLIFISSVSIPCSFLLSYPYWWYHKLLHIWMITTCNSKHCVIPNNFNKLPNTCPKPVWIPRHCEHS